MKRVKLLVAGALLTALLALPVGAGASSSCAVDAYRAYRSGETSLVEYQQALRQCGAALRSR